MSVIEKKVSKIINQIKCDILDGKYQLSKTDEHYGHITYKNTTLRVWTANGWEYCKVGGGVDGLTFPEYQDEDFKKILFDVATTKTPFTIRKQIKEARAVKKQKFQDYKNSSNNLKKLRDELSDLLLGKQS